MKYVRLSAFLLLFCQSIWAAAPKLTLSLMYPDAKPQVVLNFNPQAKNNVRCSDYDYPDNPPRAFIGPDGKVWMWASNATAYQGANLYGGYAKYGGASLNDAFSKGACQPAFLYVPVAPDNDTELSSLGSFQNLLWLQQFWVSYSATNQYQLITFAHNEFHGQDLIDCMTHRLNMCWYANVIFGRWSQQFKRFVIEYNPVGQPLPVFLSPYQYLPDGGQQGMSAQTNIVFNPQDQYYYILVLDMPPSTQANPHPQPGMCLFRSNNVNDNYSWLGWDGSQFTVRRDINPYGGNPDMRSCQHILPAEFHAALVYSPQYKSFIALGVNAHHQQNQGIFYISTQDLTNWGWQPGQPKVGTPLNIGQFKSRGLWQRSEPGKSFTAQGYFTIMDPASSEVSQQYFKQPDYNFQYVSENPYLYYVLFHAKTTGPMGSQQRDVVRQQLHISCEANCAVISEQK